MATRTRRTSPIVMAVAAAGLAFVVLPLVGLLARAPWSQAARELTSAGAWTAFRLSIVVSTAAALVTLILGFPIAWVLARVNFPGRSLVRALVILPLVLPPVVAGVGLLASLGRSGIVGRFLDRLGIGLTFTTAGAIVAAAFVSMPLMVLAVEAGLRALDPRLEGAAAASGASPWFAFRRVTLPLLRPQIAAGLVLSWARALGEFGATITFAGNLHGRTQTLPLDVFQTLQVDPGGAILVSLLLVALSLVVLVALRDRFLPR